MNDTLEDLAEQAEEALNEQYDREIRDFYFDEKERVKTERLNSLNFDLNMNMEKKTDECKSEPKYIYWSGSLPNQIDMIERLINIS